MQRRKFLAAATTAAIPLALGATSGQSTADTRQLIELRTYEMKFGGSGQKVLMDYFNNAFFPALKRLGCPTIKVMKEMGQEDPAKIWVLIAYPDAETYVTAQHLNAYLTYRTNAESYNGIPPERPVFNRFASQLLHAFTGMPQVADPGKEAGLFELRTYEGYSEDALRRKTAMFNDEELPLFDEVGLHRVFFGKMISGPYRPSLVYMLHFRDMAERDANWGTFVSHPDWKRMSSLEKYANSVSNIRRTFLVPA